MLPLISARGRFMSTCHVYCRAASEPFALEPFIIQSCQMSQPSSDLANRRAEIDQIDGEMQRLLQARAKVVQGVLRAKKAATAAGEVTPPFRPGREAEVLRKLVANHSGDFPTASLLRIWREIISGATRIQAVQRIVVLGGAGDIWDLARDHFGLGAVYEAVGSPAEAFALLSQHSIAAAVLPLASATGDGIWWRDLITAESAEGAPHIVARLPFFRADTRGQALVLSPFAPDASSLDRGLLGLRLKQPASPPEIVGLAEAAGLRVEGEPIVSGPLALIETKGLIEQSMPSLAALTALPNVIQTRTLGGYAVPLVK
jgi:chorismate mutase/prephenate dehydratase